MNKKGFTLVELLAVIILLALLAVVTSTSVTKLVSDSKKTLSESQMKMIKQSAKNWGAENMNMLPNDGECIYLKLKYLQENGYINNNITDPLDEGVISSDIYIKISAETSSIGKLQTKYEVDASNILGCHNVLSICTLLEGKHNKIGSKYECEVKPDQKYNFYVLSNESDGTTNLILDRNICDDGTLTSQTKNDKCFVAWYAGGFFNENGPVTAMNYLYNATKDWINVPNIIMNYSDEESTSESGYGGIKTTGDLTQITKRDGSIVTVLSNEIGYSNLKVRLPYLREVSDSDGSNEYLYENLDGSDWDGVESKKPTQNISEILGYWTLSSSSELDNYYAYYLSSSGKIVANYTDFYLYPYLGVRPVINVEL